MVTTEGKKGTWIKFKFADMFPSGSPVAKFVAGLALIENDLVSTNKTLIAALEQSEPNISPEGRQHFWQATAQYREAAKYIEEALHIPEVAAFILALPPDVQKNAEEVKKSCTPWEGSFVKTISKPIRDNLFHYPCPTDSAWDKVLDSLKEQESGIRFCGELLSDTRLIFADEIRVTLLAQYLGSNYAEMAESMTKLASFISAAINLSQHSLNKYLEDLPAGTFRTEEALEN